MTKLISSTMAKLAAFVAALLLVAHFSAAFRTTITIDEASESILRTGGEQCRQQIQQRDLSHCMRHLREQQRGRRGYDEGRADELNETQDFERCCNELRMIRDEECRCEGLQMEMQREQGTMRPQEMRQLLQSAQRLPNKCGMRQSPCQFEIPSY